MVEYLQLPKYARSFPVRIKLGIGACAEKSNKLPIFLPFRTKGQDMGHNPPVLDANLVQFSLIDQLQPKNPFNIKNSIRPTIGARD